MTTQKSNRPDWTKLFQEAIEVPGRLSECYRMFHEYSLGNCLLAAIQLAERGQPLGPIATFKGWKEKFNRTVKKGEKAIALVMPVTVKTKVEPTPEQESSEESVVERRIFLLKNNWFSLGQTEGDDYASQVETPKWSKANALSNLGISEEPFELVQGNIQGYAKPNSKVLAINPVAAMPWKTLFHELGHCILHTKEAQLADGASIPKSIREAEAESVAYLCCATLGLPGLEESRGYIQNWLESSENSEEFKKSASRVFSAADKILKAGSTKPGNKTVH